MASLNQQAHSLAQQDHSTSGRGPSVSVSGLCKDFQQGTNRVHALIDVSLEARAGEHLAVIGPSGSGKSTLLHLIAGLAAASGGRVSVGGQALANMNDRQLTLFRRKHIGMVFQAYNLIPSLSIEDNLRLPLLLGRRHARESEKVESTLTMLGLAERRRHRPDQLSGGEQQRAAIGRAMITDPAVILADEPTGNLDSANSRKLCELMFSLCREQGRTIITVTHDPGVAFWASKVMVLKDGRIVDTLLPSAFATARDLGARFLEVLDRKEEAAACA